MHHLVVDGGADGSGIAAVALSSVGMPLARDG